MKRAPEWPLQSTFSRGFVEYEVAAFHFPAWPWNIIAFICWSMRTRKVNHNAQKRNKENTTTERCRVFESIELWHFVAAKLTETTTDAVSNNKKISIYPPRVTNLVQCLWRSSIKWSEEKKVNFSLCVGFAGAKYYRLLCVIEYWSVKYKYLLLSLLGAL